MKEFYVYQRYQNQIKICSRFFYVLRGEGLSSTLVVHNISLKGQSSYICR